MGDTSYPWQEGVGSISLPPRPIGDVVVGVYLCSFQILGHLVTFPTFE